MNPEDALPEDWGMYYDGVWMRHDKYGVGRIEVLGGDLYLKRSVYSDPIQVRAEYLKCWWPRAGAFNCGNHAIYIARKAVRNMRKSAVAGDHYFVKWGTGFGIDIMEKLRSGPNCHSKVDATRLLEDGDMSSVAVTRDIIFTLCEDNPEKFIVIFRGMEVGTWSEISGYTPQFSGHPLTSRVLRQLDVA